MSTRSRPPPRPRRPRAAGAGPLWRRIGFIASFGLVALSVTRLVSGQDVLTDTGTAQAVLALTLPIALAGLGGLVCERAGVVNIGLEGMMILGTWGAGFAGYQWGPWAALAGALIGGLFGGLLHAVATVTFGVDHIVSGVAINLLAAGAVRFLSELLYAGVPGGGPTQSPAIKGGTPTFDVPVLASGPDLLGRLEQTHLARAERRGGPAAWPAARRQRLPGHRRADVPARRVRAVAHRVRAAAPLRRGEPVGGRVARGQRPPGQVRRRPRQRRAGRARRRCSSSCSPASTRRARPAVAATSVSPR